MKKSIVRAFNRLLGRFKSKVPTGVLEFNDWAQSIIDNYDLPTSDLDSVRYTLATIIMHSKAQDAYMPKQYFVLTLRAAAAKQIAGHVFTEIKQKQKEAELAAQNEANKAV